MVLAPVEMLMLRPSLLDELLLLDMPLDTLYERLLFVPFVPFVLFDGVPIKVFDRRGEGDCPPTGFRGI